MLLEERIFEDYKEALKSKDALKSSALSFLRAELLNVAVAKKKKQLEDNEVVTVIRKQIKSRRESIEQFAKGNRQDLVEKETREVEFLSAYLPLELSQQELKKIIDEVVISIAAQGMKDMGKVMKEVTGKVAGRADGKTLSDLVRERLTPPTE